MAEGARVTRTASPVRPQIQRVGATVLAGMVEMIVLGTFAPGDFLPPEQSLCTEFGVSRTVIRECIKRLQEKGMVTVTQGRGTQVRPFTEWNVLDTLVLSTLIQNDETLDILDEVSVVRAALEAVMAAEVARAHDPDKLIRVEAALQRMRDRIDDFPAFREADVQFHLAVMEASNNRIADNVARVLFVRALDSTRYEGAVAANSAQLTMQEHEAVFAAIAAGDADSARRAMEGHIMGSWHRRRLPSRHHH